MNAAEELVSHLCRKSFLSLWSYPNPQGKEKGKELCDVLVIFDPHVIIFSVKDVRFIDSGRPNIDASRWLRNAIDESVKQIYGAERWINSATHVITKDGAPGLPIPEATRRRVHRVAVALGGEGKAGLYFGDLDNRGFVHVFDEESLHTIMDALDTISDFVQYLTDKEDYIYGGVHIAFDGNEEDLLALYLRNNRTLPTGYKALVVGDGLWEQFTGSPQYQAKKREDESSYAWDYLIERFAKDFAAGVLLSDTDLTQMDMVLRVMAKETRFARRLLGKAIADFLFRTVKNNPLARVVTGLSGVPYVFLARTHDFDREARKRELAARCFIVRGRFPEQPVVIGIATETLSPYGASYDHCYLNLPEWTQEDQQIMEKFQMETGYFSQPTMREVREDEYPKPDSQA